MKVLATVVDEGGFSAASRKLGIPLATVSRRVSRLERYLNARLLERSTRSLRLTEVGAAYYVQGNPFGNCQGRDTGRGGARRSAR
ncbi:helix-turn-helix domain-containing protein [Cupriavidus necator]|uniref:helix-turn-helix domain-containing protein n=1 Tax=Cupriavidus necator TaxID=106590 RepID=UPI001E5A813F|nr:LysR family transcriptional regulator [Cupriavidus necator]